MRPGGPESSVGDVVFVSPHLDDAVLSCGGAIARLTALGSAVTVVTACTADVDGEAGLSALARRSHASWALGDSPFAPRREEDAEAMRLLGVDSVHLGLLDAVYRTDSGGRPLYRNQLGVEIDPVDLRRFVPSLRRRLGESLGSRGSALVFCPVGVGGHVDHVLVRRAVEELRDRHRIVYYEEYPYLSRRSKMHPWEHDRITWRLRLLELTEAELASRIEAIACYRSQVRGLFPTLPERVREILAARLPLVGPSLTCEDSKPPGDRVTRNLCRDLAACGGERYWVPAGLSDPFADASESAGGDAVSLGSTPGCSRSDT